jgi:hypothetical protein
VLCAVTKLNSIDVRSLCSCTVCGRMSLPSVLCVRARARACVCVRAPGVPVLVKSGHRVFYNVRKKNCTDLTFAGPCIVIYFYTKTNQKHNISNLFYFGTTLYMFRSLRPSSGV